MVKITIKKRAIINIGLVFLGIFVAFIILEVSLRVFGFVLLALKNYDNRIIYETGNVYHILALGESTTANLRNGQSSWTEELEIILNDRSKDIKFKVFNEGDPALGTSKILSRLNNNLDRYQPDMVITMMGTNDIDVGTDDVFYAKSILKGKLRFYFQDLMSYKLINLIKEALADKEYKEKEKMLKKTVEENLDDVNALLELGNFYDKHNNYKERTYVIKKILELKPNHFGSFLSVGLSFAKQGLYEEAEEMFKKAIVVDPNNYQIYAELGNAYKRLNRPTEGISMYEKYLSLGKMHDEHSYIQLAKLYMDTNNPENAYRILSQIVNLNPEKKQEVSWIGEIYRELNKTDDAINLFKTTIEKNPDNYVAHTELALNLLDNNRFEKAEKYFTFLMEKFPDNPNMYIEPIWYYLNNNRLDEVEEIIDRVAQINPENQKALRKVYKGIGNRYQKEGQLEEANKMFTKSLRIADDYYTSTTQDNYQKLYRIVGERGITLIIMQYPTLDVDELKKFFRTNKEIIFVSNEDNFKKALESSPYEEYFIDRYGDFWGHATKKGNQLIAENVAGVILDNIETDEN